jgi:riboflavin kinase / FMN adenylyltransferase
MQVFRGIPQRSDTPVALSIGNFDGVHLGHQAMLRRLKEIARAHGLASAVMTFEPHPREFFSPTDAPARLTTLREKLELLGDFRVERVYVCRFDLPFSQMSAQTFVRSLVVERLQTRRLLVGEDFRFGAKRGGDFALLRAEAASNAFTLEAQESIAVGSERVSSTGVRNALAAGNLEYAAALLGRPYSISGKVVHGRRLGRELGFATANIDLRHRRPPLEGIFAVKLHGVSEAALPGVASLGLRPTIAADDQPILEVHLFDFDRDIYARHVRVEFWRKLRDEAKYADLTTLQQQIAIDVGEARRFFTDDRLQENAKPS